MDKLRAVLGAHGLLDGERLRGDCGLVSIGDHFDYAGDRREVAENGLRILEFLAGHPADQVVILAGNHDLSRVMELADLDDEAFARARALGDEIALARKEGRPTEEAEARFAEEFPRIPTPEIARRDYSSFTTAQQSLVKELLLDGRMRLACAGAVGGEPVLLTHAGVTTRELDLLGAPAEAAAIASGLEATLQSAVDAVRRDWEGGGRAALELAPLHAAGRRGREGGGLLYHRPANPERDDADRAWESGGDAPRRFDPRRLPRGLHQIAGHTGHTKCLKELGSWVTERARAAAPGAIRMLWSDGATAVYDVGAGEVPRERARLTLIDGEMNQKHVRAADYRLLALDAVVAA